MENKIDIKFYNRFGQLKERKYESGLFLVSKANARCSAIFGTRPNIGHANGNCKSLARN